MNVMQLNTDIYNSLGVLSNTEWFVLEHNNAESCRQNPAGIIASRILRLFYLNKSSIFTSF